MNEYDELSEAVARYKNAQASKRKKLYAYAKANGFSPTESMFLSASTKEKIDRVIKLRDK